MSEVRYQFEVLNQDRSVALATEDPQAATDRYKTMPRGSSMMRRQVAPVSSGWLKFRPGIRDWVVPWPRFVTRAAITAIVAILAGSPALAQHVYLTFERSEPGRRILVKLGPLGRSSLQQNAHGLALRAGRGIVQLTTATADGKIRSCHRGTGERAVVGGDWERAEITALLPPEQGENVALTLTAAYLAAGNPLPLVGTAEHANLAAVIADVEGRLVRAVPFVRSDWPSAVADCGRASTSTRARARWFRRRAERKQRVSAVGPPEITPTPGAEPEKRKEIPMAQVQAQYEYTILEADGEQFLATSDRLEAWEAYLDGQFTGRNARRRRVGETTWKVWNRMASAFVVPNETSPPAGF